MIKVLVCEDSLPISQLLVELIKAENDMLVVGVAGDGLEAIELTRKLRPDVIAMDVRMPRLSGLEATRQIMAQHPTPIVMVSELAEADKALSISALTAGALAVIPKPHGPGHPDFELDGKRLCQTLSLMAEVKVIRHWLGSSPVKTRPALPAEQNNSSPAPFGVSPRLVAIGASTGGPSALASILKQLPPAFDLPIMITQHIMPGFGSGLVRWLKEATGRKVVAAEEGMTLEPHSGLTVVAPDHCHLLLTPSWKLQFDYRGPVNGGLPSVDLMFESTVQVAGAGVIGVLLTGMGRDGAQGLHSLYQAGAYTIVQNEASCVVFGMPREAIALGAARQVLPLEKIAPCLAGLCPRPPATGHPC